MKLETNEPRHEKNFLYAYVNKKVADQPSYPHNPADQHHFSLLLREYNVSGLTISSAFGCISD